MNNLTFEPCDKDVFRLVDLAYETGDKGGLYPTVMNAANESAVMSYLAGKIRFLDIERTVFETVNKMDPVISGADLTIETIEQTDKEARIYADEIIDRKIKA